MAPLLIKKDYLCNVIAINNEKQMPMRKLLHISVSLLLFAFCLPVAAKVVTIDLKNKGFTNSEKVTTVVQDGITLTFAKAEGQTDPAYYDIGTAVRCYIGNTLTISAAYDITDITFTF